MPSSAKFLTRRSITVPKTYFSDKSFINCKFLSVKIWNFETNSLVGWQEVILPLIINFFLVSPVWQGHKIKTYQLLMFTLYCHNGTQDVKKFTQTLKPNWNIFWGIIFQHSWPSMSKCFQNIKYFWTPCTWYGLWSVANVETLSQWHKAKEIITRNLWFR